MGDKKKKYSYFEWQNRKQRANTKQTAFDDFIRADEWLEEVTKYSDEEVIY